MKKFLLLSAVLAAQPIATHAVEYVDWVDWEQIEHWAGDPDGQNKCALVIDFQDKEVPTRSFGVIAGTAPKPAKTLSALSLRRAAFSRP